MAKTYESYKDSGIAWIGEIPSEWKVGLVGRYFNEIKNPNINQEEKNTLQFKMGDIISKKRGDSKYNPETIEAYNVVEPGTIMINGLNLSFDFISQRVGQVHEKGAITSTYLALYPSNGMMSDYAKYLLKAYDNCKALHAMGRGLRATLSYGIFRSEPILIPSIDEQHSIASFLDTKCGEIDSLISLQEEMISELQAYKQSVITEAVTKGLDPNAKMNCCASREKNDACISSSETQPAIERKFKDSGVEWMPQIPQSWNTRRLKDVGFLYGGLTGKSGEDFNVDDDEDSYMLYIPFTNIFNNSVINPKQMYKVKIEKGEHQNLVFKDDLLFLMSSEDYDGVGKPAIIEEQIDNLGLNSFCKGFRVTDNKTLPKYLFYYLSSHISREQVRQEAKGFIRINLRQDKLSCCNILVPPFDEQRSIATYLDAKTSQIDSLISLKQQKIDELKSYKKSIIYEYVTGKKRV